MQTNQFWGDVPIPYRCRVAVWEKPDDATLILGTPITIDRHLFADDEIGTWADSNDNFGGIHLSADGRRLSCYQSRLIPRHDPFLAHYDNILADRIMVTWSTSDGLNWTPRFFDAPTLDDPWGTQHYGVDVWQEEKGDLMLAYHRLYDVQQQKVCTELAFSRDGIYWQRVQAGRPFLPTGERGSFNYGYAITTGNNRRVIWNNHCYEVMQGINVLHFMFLAVFNRDDRSFVTPEFFEKRFGGGRMTGEHGVENSPVMNDYESWEDICAVTKTQMFTPALMRYRVDGWVSALPEREQAEFTTRLLQARGGMRINARTEPDGFIRIELQDAHGNPVPLYSGANAAVFNGDDTDAALSWQKGRLTAVPELPFKIKVTIVKGEIFTMTL